MPITVRPLAPLAARLERMEGGQGSWQEAVAHFTKELGHSLRVPVSFLAWASASLTLTLYFQIPFSGRM